MAPAHHMFQYKIDEIFKELPNVFDIDDDILLVGYDADDRDHARMLKQVIQICYKENCKLNKDRYHLRYMRVPFSNKSISRHSVPNPHKLHTLTDMPPTNKNEQQSFLGNKELFWQAFTSHSRGIQTSAKTDISKGGLNIDIHLATLFSLKQNNFFIEHKLSPVH